MELQTTCGRVGLTQTVFDDVEERPVDGDFVLPDYLPEITAILKCRMRPVVQSHQISGDRVIADGTVYLQLLYLDEERCCVHSYEHAQPFSAAFTVKELKNGDAVRLLTKVNYVNCRATSPRRVDVHGAFGVRLTVIAERAVDIVTEAAGEGLHTRSCLVQTTVPTGCAQKSLSVNEVLELGETAVGALVRGETAAVITECRQMRGKAVVKGELLITAVCVTDTQSGMLHHHSERIPFSLIVDAEGLTEDAVCDCRAAVASCDMRPVQDPAGEMRLLSVAAKLTVSLCCYGTEPYRCVNDAFHTAYPLKTETERLYLERVAYVRSDVTTLTLTQALPDGDITEVVDVWCEPMAVECVGAEGQTMLHGQLLTGMITRDGGGMLTYYERPVDYEATLPDACERETAEVMPQELSFSKNGGQLECRLQLAVHRVGKYCEEQTVITQLALDDTSPYAVDGVLAGCCLKVCYAPSGESVWELARREHTSPEAIKNENGLTADVLERDTVLLIPLR